MDEIQTYLGADGLMHCTVCKEPVEAFYPKGSLLEMKKHHRQCACERQAYAAYNERTDVLRDRVYAESHCSGSYRRRTACDGIVLR